MHNPIEQGISAQIQEDIASEPTFTADVARKQQEVATTPLQEPTPIEPPLPHNPTVEKSERIAMGVASLIAAAPGAGLLRTPQAQVQYGEASYQKPIVAPTGERLITPSTTAERKPPAESETSLETNQVYDLVVTDDELAQTGLAVSSKQTDYDIGIFKPGYIKDGDHLYGKYVGDDVFILENHQPGKSESFGDGSVLLTADPSHPFIEAVGKIEQFASPIIVR